jgi:hypothetical protein
MRGKIIAVNAGILLVVGLLTYALLASSLASVLQDRAARRAEATRVLRGATAQLELDALRVERWLSTRANGRDVRAVYSPGTVSARQQAATALADELHKAAAAEPDFDRMAPDMVLFVDGHGVALGRNGSNLMRGERIADAYPSLAQALRTGVTASDLWVHSERQEQWLASYAPVRGAAGDVIGAVIFGTPLTDDRLARTRELSTGSLLFAAVVEGDRLRLLAKGGKAPPGVVAVTQQPALAALASAALADRKASGADLTVDGYLLGVAPLVGYGDRGVLIAAIPAALVDSLAAELWPVLAATVLGLLLVVIAGHLLGNYIQGPIGQLEEGLLAVINGRTDFRFELEHAELGGLVFRLNSLLNALTGVPEDSTDEQGRPSTGPSAGHFREAIGVDERSGQATESQRELVARLAAEPTEQYYSRLFAEYLEARRSLGDPAQHLTLEGFVRRLVESESEAASRYGHPVRYRVGIHEEQVVLIAVPLPE